MMKSAFFLSLIALAYSTQALAAFPEALNTATYSFSASDGTTGTLVETIASIAPATDATDTTGGQASLTVALNGVVDPSQNSTVAVNDLKAMTTLVANCAAAADPTNGVTSTLEPGIQVPYGTFDSCHISFADTANNAQIDTWYGKVPFGVLKQSVVYTTTGADGSSAKMTQTTQLTGTNTSL
jgi:hypothetical protein